MGYSTAQPALFKQNQLEPVRDLKLLIKDYAPIAKNALLILINLSEDEEVVKDLVDDDAFLESLLRRVTVCQYPICRFYSFQELTRSTLSGPEGAKCE